MFDQIQLGTVRWQEPKVEILSFPFRYHFLKRSTAMDLCVVDHNGGGLRQRLAKTVHARDDRCCINRTFEHVRFKVSSVVLQEPKHVELSTFTAGDFETFARWLPAVRHAGGHRKTRLVEIEQINLALDCLLFHKL